MEKHEILQKLQEGFAKMPHFPLLEKEIVMPQGQMSEIWKAYFNGLLRWFVDQAHRDLLPMKGFWLSEAEFWENPDAVYEWIESVIGDACGQPEAIEKAWPGLHVVHRLHRRLVKMDAKKREDLQTQGPPHTENDIRVYGPHHQVFPDEGREERDDTRSWQFAQVVFQRPPKVAKKKKPDSKGPTPLRASEKAMEAIDEKPDQLQQLTLDLQF